MNSETKDNKGKKYFIVFICMLIQAIPYCIAQNLQGQMQTPVSHSGFISEIAFTMLYFSGTLPVLLNPFFNKLYDKINIKYIYIIGLIIGGLGFASYGFAINALTFNLSAAVTQIGTILFTGLSLPHMMAAWFPGEGRGTALGIALAGGSIGNVFLQPIVVNLLTKYGWQRTYMILGAIIAIVGIPLVLLFIRFPRKGEVIKEKAVIKNDHHITYEGLSDKENMKNKYYWLFNIGALLLCLSVVAISTQAIPILVSKGFESSKIAIAGSVFGISCLIGNVGGGKLFDKLGSFKPMMISFGGTILSLLIMAFMPKESIIGFLIPILSGLTIFTITSGPAFMPPDIFGHKDGMAKMAKTGMFYALGSSVGAVGFTSISNMSSLRAASLTFLVIAIIGYTLNGFAIIKARQMFVAKEKEN